MIILVKVNQTYKPGSDPKLSAYRSWILGRLLDDPKIRNQYKYLVAYYYGEVVGTFCIHGVALDPPYVGNRRVKFLLMDTSDECDIELKRIIADLIRSDSNRIRRTISCCKIDTNHLKSFKANYEDFNCKCAIDSIPVLKSDEILE